MSSDQINKLVSVLGSMSEVFKKCAKQTELPSTVPETAVFIDIGGLRKIASEGRWQKQK